jgi:hypothetical protein
VYIYLGKHPDKAKNFAASMSINLSGDGYNHKYLIECGPWSSIAKNALVVDVGGSDGNLMVALARAFPFLRCVVQDLPSQIQRAPPLPEDVADRISMQEYDFVTPQQVKADVYVFRWIFHNWADKYCLQILENLIPMLQVGCRILLNEVCLPEPNATSKRWERRLRYVGK